MKKIKPIFQSVILFQRYKYYITYAGKFQYCCSAPRQVTVPALIRLISSHYVTAFYKDKRKAVNSQTSD